MPGDWIRRSTEDAPFYEATLTHEVMLKTVGLELPHRDPADRFLVAFTRYYDLTLVTATSGSSTPA